MIRKLLLLSFLALSTSGCIDDDPEDGPTRSGEDDPDFEEPTDGEDDAPNGCRASLQQDEEDPACTPK